MGVLAAIGPLLMLLGLILIVAGIKKEMGVQPFVSNQGEGLGCVLAIIGAVLFLIGFALFAIVFRTGAYAPFFQWLAESWKYVPPTPKP